MVRVSLPGGGEAAIPVADFTQFKETVLSGKPWQKEEKNNTDEPDRKPILPRGGMTGMSRIVAKPEKITIEEHLAERVNLRPTHRPSQGQAPQNSQREEGGAGAAKKRQRRHKNVLPDSRKQEEQTRAQRTKEIHRPPEQRPGNEPAEIARKDIQGGTQANGVNARGVHTHGIHSRRQRYKGGNRGRERPAPGGAGAAGKGDS